MKNFALPSFILLSLILLSACGTIDSLKDKSTYVSYARVLITESLAVGGRVLSMIDSTINLRDIKGYPLQSPQPRAGAAGHCSKHGDNRW